MTRYDVIWILVGSCVIVAFDICASSYRDWRRRREIKRACDEARRRVGKMTSVQRDALLRYGMEIINGAKHHTESPVVDPPAPNPSRCKCAGSQ